MCLPPPCEVSRKLCLNMFKTMVVSEQHTQADSSNVSRYFLSCNRKSRLVGSSSEGRFRIGFS